MRDHPPPKVRESRGLKALLAIFTALALVILVAGVTLAITNGRVASLKAREDYLLSLSASVAAQTDGLFKETLFALASFDLWIQANPDRDPRSDPEFLKYFEEFKKATGGLLDLRFVSKTGGLFYIPSSSTQALADVRERDYYNVQMNPATRGFYVGEAVKSKVTGKWGLPLSYPLRPNAFGLAVILAMVDLDSLSKVYSGFLPSPQGSIVLAKDDGLVLTREPFNAAYIGAKIELPRRGSLRLEGSSTRAIIAYKKGIDGPERIIAYRNAGNSGAFITVSSTMAETVENWTRTLPYFLIGGILIISLILFISLKLRDLLGELDRAQLDLVETVRGLEESRASRDKLFSIISHDLRGPVGGIKSLLENLSESSSSLSEEELAESLAALAQASNNTYQLLEDLLTWSRSQSGAMPFKPSRVALIPLIEDCIEDVEAQASAKGIEIRTHIAAGMSVNADVDMLRTIIRNLINNAVKFSPEGKNVLVEAEDIASGTRVVVSDNGVGMDGERISKLFVVGALRSKPGTAGEKGTGLGLVVVKDFMDRHGGTITVKSEIGKGSAFTLFFPKES